MATSIRWPGFLPQSIPVGSKVTRQSNVIVSQTEIGPRKYRRRFTAVTRTFEPQKSRWIFSESQSFVFEDFFDRTLKGGALTFMWNNPLAGWGDVECRISGVPERSIIIPGDSSMRKWAYSMKVEVLPNGS